MQCVRNCCRLDGSAQTNITSMPLPSHMDCYFLATPALTPTLLAIHLCPDYFSCCPCLYIGN